MQSGDCVTPLILGVVVAVLIFKIVFDILGVLL